MCHRFASVFIYICKHLYTDQNLTKKKSEIAIERTVSGLRETTVKIGRFF